MFIQHLKRLGIYNAPDGDDGGSSKPTGRSLESLTNSKVTGTLDNPEGESPKSKPAQPDKSGDDPAPEPKSKLPKGDDDEDTPAAGKAKAASEDDDDEFAATGGNDEKDPAPGKSGDEPAGDPEIFYDPEKHVEGKPAHSNTFKTREDGEYAAVQKAARLKETFQKMKDEGIDRGAIPLPSAMNGSEDSLDDLTNLEVVVSMSDDQLRAFLNESDGFRQKLENKFERKKQAKQLRESKDKYEKLQVETYDNLTKLMSPEEVKANLDKFAELDAGKKFAESKIDEKVKAELEEDRNKLSAWIDKVDAGDISMSFKEFDEEKQRRVAAMKDKADKIRSNYTPVLEQLESLYELSKDVDQAKEMSPEKKREKMWSAFSEWQEDRSDDLAMLDDEPSARAELVSFKQWAVQNAADFNDLLHPADFNDAAQKWEDFKQKVRAGRQRADLNGDNKNKKAAGSAPDNDDIPKPGDQQKIKGDKDKSVGDVRRRSLDKLEELTNATVGT